MFIVYFLLTIHDQVSKELNYGIDCEIPTKGIYVIKSIVVGQTIVKEDTLLDIIVKLNLNINVKIKSE